MFTQAFFYFFTREIYYTSILVSLVIARCPLGLCPLCSHSTWLAVLGMVGLVGSKAFIGYSTSGLENPLTHLLLSAFAAAYLRREEERGPLWLGRLGLLNRVDLGLLFCPGLMWALWERRSMASVGWAVVGMAPFAIWEIFSLIYYGFPFPNTAYAKLAIGVPARKLFEKGIGYLVQSYRNDPLTPLIVLLGLGLPLIKRTVPTQHW